MTIALQTMIASYEEAYREDQILWGIPCEIEDLPAMKEKPRRRVQVGKLIVGRDDAGNDTFQPIFAYSEAKIREEASRSFDAGVGLFCNPKNTTQMAVRKAKWDAWADSKIAELATIEAACKEFEDACGYTVALKAAVASSDRVRALENSILEYVPTSLDEAAIKSRWIVQGMNNSRAYFNDREDFAEVAFAAIGRAGE
ncbi:hypothetical protein ASF70_18765 [Rhizobium sp. Leaf321]|uniref:hypothetical protein n=1 Tax=Rhizobium sp. Leaf321 TaxID=1736335 RepID=UPI0007148C30|nr:hypothetical protein [Rhizobium sp. Leaf321]KQQ70891.1 hypothetical protein ASF70_18765 [Rhizobium sp. Leaf321]